AHERIAVETCLALVDPDDEEMPRMHMFERRHPKRQPARHFRKQLAIALGEPRALAVHLVEARKLTHAERRVHVRQVVLVPGLDHLGLRCAALGLALIRIRGETVEAQAPYMGGTLLLLSADDAAFARREVLDRVQREDRSPARAEFLAGVRRARDVRRVLDEWDAAPAGERPPPRSRERRARGRD